MLRSSRSAAQHVQRLSFTPWREPGFKQALRCLPRELLPTFLQNPGHWPPLLGQTISGPVDIVVAIAPHRATDSDGGISKKNRVRVIPASHKSKH